MRYIYHPGPHFTAAPEIPSFSPLSLHIHGLYHWDTPFNSPARCGVALGVPVLCRVNVTEAAVSACGCPAQPFAGTGSSLCSSCKSAGHKPPQTGAVWLWDCGAKPRFAEMSFFSARPGGLSLASMPRMCTKHQLWSGIPIICSTLLCQIKFILIKILPSFNRSFLSWFQVW